MVNLQEAMRWFKNFRNKQLLYQLVFGTLDGKKVLEDLASFCFLDSTTADVDPYAAARKEGRRQVILYLLHTLRVQVNDVGDYLNVTERSGYTEPGDSDGIKPQYPEYSS